MKNFLLFCTLFGLLLTESTAQDPRNVEVEQKLNFEVDTISVELTKDLMALKETVNNLKIKDEETEKGRFLRNYQLILRGLDIIQELYAGTLQIQSARSQNIFYKLVLDMNNPSSNALGFQLLDVIIKSVEENITTLPIPEPDKQRLTGSIGNLVDNLKTTFPPLNIISNVLSMVSSFTIFKPRMEKKGEMSIESVNPVGKEVLGKIKNVLVPYIEFYSELDKVNNRFQNAIYQHGVQHKDYIENLYALKQEIENSGIDFKVVLAAQVNKLFDYDKMGNKDFDFKIKNTDETIKKLIINAYSVFDLVVQFKKYTNDFVLIQNDFYQSYIQILEKKVMWLPVKDDSKIQMLLTDLNNTKSGNEAEGIVGFDVAYKQRLNNVILKLAKMNEIRY